MRRAGDHVDTSNATVCFVFFRVVALITVAVTVYQPGASMIGF
jgi:hypothetical protein